MKEHLSGDASPTERTMAWLREQGYTVDKVEQKVRRNVTRDFMGFADVLAIDTGHSAVLAVQATDSSHFAERIDKVCAEPRARTWLDAYNRLWVVCWDKGGADGKRKTFRHRAVEIRMGEDKLYAVDFPGLT